LNLLVLGAGESVLVLGKLYWGGGGGGVYSYGVYVDLCVVVVLRLNLDWIGFVVVVVYRQNHGLGYL
jgi:hypothetical protein